MAIGRLHVITAPAPAGDLLDAVALLAAAGAPTIQLRAKGLTDAAGYRLARAAVDRCERHGATLIVNDRADVARAAGAGGVHVGSDDLPVEAARTVVGPRALVGATCRDPESARRAEADGADYLGVGPVYRSTSKAGLPDPLGPAGVARVAAAVSVPVIAIAGVTVRRVPELLDAGAHGVAVIGAVAAAADPVAAVAELLASLAVAAP